MKRALLSTVAIVLLGGGLGVGQWVWTPPGCPPVPAPPPEPPCFTAFWIGEPILVQLALPWGLFWCCPCPAATLITGWRVEAFGGGVVFSHTFPVPVAAGTKIVWDQRDLTGAPVAAGFYRIVVTTTDREVAAYVRIDVRKPCCVFPWFGISRPCAIPWCAPHLKLSRAPTCVAPCCPPALFPFWFPFLFIVGSGG